MLCECVHCAAHKSLLPTCEHVLPLQYWNKQSLETPSLMYNRPFISTTFPHLQEQSPRESHQQNTPYITVQYIQLYALWVHSMWQQQVAFRQHFMLSDENTAEFIYDIFRCKPK